MPGLTFVHPWMLWGLLAGSIPIIIHLLNKRRYKPVPWAAMRFLREAIRVNARRIQIEDVILMLLRSLTFILVALAFALPIYRGRLLAGRQPHVCAVILMDDSYSMNYVDGETSRFERAREVARKLVGRLRRGDSVSIIMMSGRPRRLFREPTFDLDLARDLIGRLECSYAASGADKALAMAREDVARARQSSRLLYIISDFQKGLLAKPACLAHLNALEKEARLFAVPVGEGYESNLAVTALETEAGVVAVGVPTTVHARVRNFGRSAQQDYPVELYIDGKRRDRRWVNIDPGAEVDVTFLAEFRQAGQHALEIRLPADSLATDNARYRVVDVRRKVPILLISGEVSAGDRVGATEYVGMALAPGWLVGETDEDHLSPVRVNGSSFPAKEIERYPVVFLINVPVLRPSQVAALEHYVAQGGGLMIIPGDRIDVRFYNERLFRDGKGLMPARIGPAGFRRQQDGCFLSPETYDHPVLSVFADRSGGDLTRARFDRTLALDVPTTSRVVCKFSTGRPALVEKRFGKGRVMLFASGLGRDWGNFVYKPAFLIFIRRAADYLMRREAAGLNLSVYDEMSRFERGGSAAGDLAVVDPAGERSLAEVESAVGGIRVRYSAVVRPGIYRLVNAGQTVGRFAANINARESDLGLPPMGLNGKPLRVIEPGEIAQASEPGTAGGGLWMICLKAALALMIIEALFALWIESREKKPGRVRGTA